MQESASSQAARTDPRADNPDLKGRSYAIPFDRVWKAAILLVEEELAGWRVVSWDDRRGTIRAEAQTRFFKRVDEIQISITLDANAQTRVDMSASVKEGRSDFSRNTRRIALFMKSLDRKLGAGPKTIIHPTPDVTSGRRAGSS